MSSVVCSFVAFYVHFVKDAFVDDAITLGRGITSSWLHFFSTRSPRLVEIPNPKRRDQVLIRVARIL